MQKIKIKLRALIKRIYCKLNPQYKHIVHLLEMVNDLQNKIGNLEFTVHTQTLKRDDSLDRLFLASDTIVYRYMYLARCIKENDRVLDFECQYGVGADLLSKYTAIDTCLCLNSIDYYSKLGGRGHGNCFSRGCFFAFSS